MKLSIVVPCFNEEEAIPLFANAWMEIVNDIKLTDWEIIFIDDGSTDKSLNKMKEQASLVTRGGGGVHTVSFSRNFGKEAAMVAGLEYARGEYVAVMDVDLQDPPALLPQMLELLETTDYDCVATRRVTRTGEPVLRSFFAKMFYKLINKISDTPIVDGARDYRLMTRQMVDAILQLPEYNRFSKGLFQWIGFKTHWLEYENLPRSGGKTKWSFWKLFLYSIDGIVAFSTAPLALASVLGLAVSGAAFVLGIYFLLQKIIIGNPVQGYAAMILIILAIGGMQMFCLGILGQYLAKVYLEVKHRPNYVVKESSLSHRDTSNIKSIVEV